MNSTMLPTETIQNMWMKWMDAVDHLRQLHGSHRSASHRPASHRSASHRPASHRPASHRPASHITWPLIDHRLTRFVAPVTSLGNYLQEVDVNPINQSFSPGSVSATQGRPCSTLSVNAACSFGPACLVSYAIQLTSDTAVQCCPVSFYHLTNYPATAEHSYSARGHVFTVFTSSLSSLTSSGDSPMFSRLQMFSTKPGEPSPTSSQPTDYYASLVAHS